MMTTGKKTEPSPRGEEKRQVEAMFEDVIRHIHSVSISDGINRVAK
jgi:hypothetical protein